MIFCTRKLEKYSCHVRSFEMKLRGSMLEDDIRTSLIAGHKWLFGKTAFEDDRFTHLLSEIKGRFPTFATAYLLDWTPDQGFDCYRVLINTEYIFYVDIDRDDWSVNEAETQSVSNYKKGLKKHPQLWLMIALDLAANDMKRETKNEGFQHS